MAQGRQAGKALEDSTRREKEGEGLMIQNQALALLSLPCSQLQGSQLTLSPFLVESHPQLEVSERASRGTSFAATE